MRVTGKCFNFMEPLSLQGFFFFKSEQTSKREFCSRTPTRKCSAGIREPLFGNYCSTNSDKTDLHMLKSVKERDITGLVESQRASPRDICNCKGKQDNFRVEKVHQHSTSVFVKEDRTISGWRKLAGITLLQSPDMAQLAILA